MAREMRLPKDLQPEQLDVLNRATAPNPNEFIFVQGVAGSGKTTIALNIARKVGEVNASRLVESRQTILFLTYNDRLAEYCRNTLLNQAAITQMVTKDKNNFEDGYINVMTVSDLFRLSVPLQPKERFLSDEECINYISTVAAHRGIRDLLSSQIFSLISTFLRGRPELSDKKIDELNEIIDSDMHRSAHYRMYGESLQEIRRRLLSTYEDWKRNNRGVDRSDSAKMLRNQLLEIENRLMALPELQAEYLRKISRRKLGDGDLKTFLSLEWADSVFSAIQSIPKFEDQVKTYRSILASESVKQDQLNAMRDTIYSSIPEVGLRATSVWKPICSHLRNPLIIVDEIQDLSPIECENLISLWFQLSRTRESHLILLGDLNQQITPSGFEWRTLHELLEEKSEIYQEYGEKPDVHDLSNNYRTTDEIASFVQSVMKNVVPKALADQEIADRFLRYSIDPSTTLAINLVEKIEQIKKDGGDLVPHVLVGSNELFRQGLDEYIKILQKQENSDDNKLLSTVIITEHGTQLDDLISEELSQYVLHHDLIEVIPVLSCKGLEFDRCVLHGLSIKNVGEIEQDLVSRWYTSFTRAKLQLLIYLTEQEFEFIQKLGWDQIPADVALVKRVTSANDIAKELEQLGKTDLDDEARYSIAEANLARFIQTGSEDFLQKSLRLLKQGELYERYRQVAWQGAELHEKRKNYLTAANYYQDAESPVDEVRCLALHTNQLLIEKDTTDEIKQYRDRALIIAQNTQELEDQAKCWLVLEEYDKALNTALKSGDVGLQQEIASKVAHAIRGLSNDQPENAALYAELLEDNKYWDAAALSWASLSKWENAFRCATKTDKTIRDKVAVQAEILAQELASKKDNEARVIATKLDENKYYKLAAQIWLKLRDIPFCVQSLVNLGALDRAEIIVKSPEYKTTDEQKNQAYAILAKGLHKNQKDWHRSYYYYHLAGLDEECNRIELECRNLEDYHTLATCYSETRKFGKVINLANELELTGNDKKELIAEFWQMAEEWERSANAWMRLFFENIERAEELFGPKPDRKTLPHPSSLNRFYNNVEKNRSNYLLLLTDWEVLSKYESEPRRLYENLARIVEIISKSDKWQQEATFFLKLVRDRAKFALSRENDDIGKVKLPDIGKGIATTEINNYWNKLEVVNDVFQQRAVQVSTECYQKDDKLLGISLMHGVCKWRDEAIKMSEALVRGDSDLWIKSWKQLEYSNDHIERKIFNLNLTTQADLIRKAIFEIYQDNPGYKQKLWEKYRDKLIEVGSRRSQEILRKYFPEYQPPKTSEINNLLPDELQVADLIKEITDNLGNLSLIDGDRIELRDQLNSMLGVIGTNDRLAAKWKMAKSIMPNDPDKNLMVKIEKLDELIQNAQTESQVGLKENKVATPRPTVEATIVEKTPTRARHRSKQTSISPGTLQRLDLHEHSLEDAEAAFEGAFRTYVDDKSVGALLIVHGYGKDKSASVIKDWLENRTKRLKHHKCVRRVIKGEEINDAFDASAQLIRQAVESIDFSEIGVNNPGITVIVFNRN